MSVSLDNCSFSLDQIDVASPCSTSWEAMRGDDRIRHCDQCKLNVYNIAEMSRSDAEELIRSSEGRLCVRFFRRSDGTILTRDCPIGLRAVRRQLARMVVAIGALVAVLSLGTIGAASGSGKRTANGPLSKLVEWIDPSTGFAFAGALVSLIQTNVQPMTTDDCEPGGERP